MREHKTVGFVEIAQPCQELPVRLGNIIKCLGLVRIKRLQTAYASPYPGAAPTSIIACPQHPQIVIAAQCHEILTPGKLDEALDDTARVRAPIHVIPQKNEGVFCGGLHELEQRIKRARTTVDITNG
jgi:hypothetical protein